MVIPFHQSIDTTSSGPFPTLSPLTLSLPLPTSDQLPIYLDLSLSYVMLETRELDAPGP